MPLTPHLPIKYGFDPDKPPEVPESAKNEGHFFPSFDNRLWMLYRLWEPPADVNVKATLLIVHGTVDHSGVYRELAEKFTPQGVAVVAMDMRGWGLSDGESMYFHDVDTFVQDVVSVYQRVHDLPRYRSVKKRFLLGKSLGGLITAYAVRDHPDLWSGLLGLSGAYALDSTVTPPSYVISMLQVVAYFVPKKPFKKLFDEHLIVADESALQAWRDDQLCCKDPLRLGYGLEIFRTSQVLPDQVASKLNLAMLMMIGDQDKVVMKSGHELMVARNQHTDKELKVYPGGRHNLLQEPTLKEAVTKDILEWIVARV
mmetsp:Transcript_9468/g.18126  ORF Transcript_9468/g.18126 Transcript_9468/m.18126 type:complete len:313 (+) Transcript_9468:156-1094(+)|eukprot:scaffold2667_cov237-Amphora_coffeaeformis.AAC.1